MPDVRLLLGDCLESLRGLPDASVDACVTDPPYGLSPDTPKAIADRVSRFLSKLMFPNFQKDYAELAQQIDLTGIPLDGSDLSRRKIFAVVESRVGVPERAINLDGGVQVRHKEVKACAESTACASNGELAFKADPTPCEFLGDYILDFRDTLDAAARDVLGCGFTEFSPSGITMPVTPLFLPEHVCSLSRLILGSTAGLGHVVGSQHNARGQSGAASGIGASGGTVDAWMLRFDVARRTIELVATDRAGQSHGFSQSAAPKLVRAGAATSSLAAKFESHRVGLVFPTANGTRAFHLHVWLPSNLWSLLTSILPRGGFMNKGWDHAVPSMEVWREVFRVLKPGAHLLSFFGTRTYHRGVVAIEDAGFEIRDQIGWAYGSGFPKSLNLGNGWGTALKPAWEPIVVARKPLKGTVAANVLAWGTGAINVDGCRVGTNPADFQKLEKQTANLIAKGGKGKGWRNSSDLSGANPAHKNGRWPANLIHDGSEEVLAGFPDGAPAKAGRTAKRGGSNWHGRDGLGTPDAIGTWPADPGGSAARFFYCAKASKSDREDGLDGFKAERHADRQVDDGPGGDNPRNRTNQPRRNHHPTVKPTELMRYLCRLVTPPGGVVLDPFMGSGSTGRGAVLEGFGFIGCELDGAYLEIARARIEAVSLQAEESSGQLPLF